MVRGNVPPQSRLPRGSARRHRLAQIWLTTPGRFEFDPGPRARGPALPARAGHLICPCERSFAPRADASARAARTSRVSGLPDVPPGRAQAVSLHHKALDGSPTPRGKKGNLRGTTDTI